MAASADALKLQDMVAKLQDMVECVICLEQYEDPRSLPCQHSFCAKCLVGMLGAGRLIRCPCCKREAPVPDGVHALPVDFRANSWLQIMQEYNKSDAATEAEDTQSESGSTHGGSGTAGVPTTEGQLLLSIEKNKDHPEALSESLSQLINLFRSSPCTNQTHTVEIILPVMERHPRNERVQVKGSCALCLIVPVQDKFNLDDETKRRTISTILDAMDNHMDSAAMMRNACLAFIHFDFPQDIVFVYARLVTVLVEVVGVEGQKVEVQHLCIRLLNELICSVDSEAKQQAGHRGAILMMLKIIQKSVEHELSDDMMETTWSTLWNITDETPLNSERFVTEGGMEMFLQSREAFNGKPKLIHKLMGVMGNIAEVPHLRPCLRQKRFILIFSELLDCEGESGEISYSACGVLAHLVSDGEGAWLLREPAHSDVTRHMVQAMQRWDMMTKFMISYNSFRPMLHLLTKYDTPECQHFALWVVCNSTTMDPGRYCPMLQQEGGLRLVQQVLNDPRPYPVIRQLAQDVLTLFNKHYAGHAAIPGAATNPHTPSGSTQQAVSQNPTGAASPGVQRPQPSAPSAALFGQPSEGPPSQHPKPAAVQPENSSDNSCFSNLLTILEPLKEYYAGPHENPSTQDGARTSSPNCPPPTSPHPPPAWFVGRGHQHRRQGPRQHFLAHLGHFLNRQRPSFPRPPRFRGQPRPS